MVGCHFVFPGFKGEEGGFEAGFGGAEFSLTEHELVGDLPEGVYPVVGTEEFCAAEGAVFAVLGVEGLALGTGDCGDVEAAGFFDDVGSIGVVVPGEVVDCGEEREGKPKRDEFFFGLAAVRLVNHCYYVCL